MQLHAPFKNWFEIIHIYHRKNRNYTWAGISTNRVNNVVKKILKYKVHQNKTKYTKYI